MKTGLAILTVLLSTCFGRHPNSGEDGYCHTYDNSCDNPEMTYSFADDGTHYSGTSSSWAKITKAQYDFFVS